MSKDNGHHMCIDFASHIFTRFSCLILQNDVIDDEMNCEENIHKQVFRIQTIFSNQKKNDSVSQISFYVRSAQ